VRRSVLLLSVAAAVFGLAGCAEETSGSARPNPTSDPTTAATEQSEETTTTEEQAGGLADVEPCDLLPASGATQLGLTEGTETSIGQGRTCRWRFEGTTLDDSFTVDLVLHDERGIDEVVGTNITPITIGGHDAVRFNDSTGGCIVSIAVGDTSRVDSLATGGNLQRGCELTDQLAAAVEPQLP
jgi:hypothetical protein